MNALERSALSRDEARSLTDEVKGDAERLWRKLVELYEGDAHVTLGYSSWGAYFKAEFGGEKSQAYRILDAGRVAAALDSPTGGTALLTERNARELAPLLKNPVALREAWAEVVERHPEPAAADVREVVAERTPAMSTKATINAKAAHRKLGTTLSAVEGYSNGLSRFVRTDLALLVASDEEVKGWCDSIALSVRALNQLKRTLEGGKQDAA